MYEFQFGKGPMDPKAPRYVLPDAFEVDMGEKNPPAGRVDRTSIDSLGLKVGAQFRLLVRLRRRLVAPDQRRGHRGQGSRAASSPG